MSDTDFLDALIASIESGEISAELVVAARQRAKLTQEQCASLVYLGSVARWSEYERGKHQIDMARWVLFLIVTDQHPRRRIVPRRKRRLRGQDSNLQPAGYEPAALPVAPPRQ